MLCALLASLLFCVAHAEVRPIAARGAGADLLVNQFGAAVPASSLSGRFLLVYFGYTSCPDLCPAALTRMTSVLDLLGKDGQALLPLFVTVDPARDTVAVLRQYVSHFHPRLLALTGSTAAVADAAASFNAQFRLGAPDSSGRYAVDHSVLLYLADRQGKVVQLFHPQQSVAEIAAAIRPRLVAREAG